MDDEGLMVKREMINGGVGLLINDWNSIFYLIYRIEVIMGDFKTLRVWSDGLDLAEKIYRVTKNEPFSRDYGLKDQIQRASVSISSNIAEGEERKTVKEAIFF